MRLIPAVLILLLVAGCSSSKKPGSIEDLPPLKNEVIPAPPELVYTRLSEALAKCFGDSGNLSVYEDKREMHQVIGIITDDLSLGYIALLKATVAPGTSGTSRVSYSWQNPFWEGYALKMQDWARGNAADCK